MLQTVGRDDLQIIVLDGAVNAFTLPALNVNLAELRHKNFVVDLQNVDQLDSAGITWLVKLLKTARLRGGNAVLVWSRSENANRMIRLTQFDKIFAMASNLDNAVQLVA